MAYGYATGNYSPHVQSAGNQAAAQTRRHTQAAPVTQTGQQAMATSPAGGPVTPTGQISQTGGGTMAPANAQPQNSTYYNWGGTPLMGQMQSSIMQALGSPLFGPDQVAQMKGAAKDSNALMTQQLQGQIGQNAASRGTFGSGQQAATERRLGQGMAGDLLGKYRDIDLQVPQMNRDALSQMLGIGMGYTQLDEGLNQSAVGTALANKDMDIRKLLGLEGISAQREGNRMGMAGNLISSLLGYQGNLDQMGYNYSALDANQQNAMLDRLLRGI